MDLAPQADAMTVDGLRRLVPLLREIGDLKRMHVAHRPGSLAEQGFARAWSRIAGGHDPEKVAIAEAVRSVAAARLAGIDAFVLAEAGLSREAAATVLRGAVRDVGEELDGTLRGRLDEAIDGSIEGAGWTAPPPFVDRLARQPRAGATRPGQSRLMLEPAENHAEHCYVTAIYGVLIAPVFGCRPSAPFIAGLAHHLHNAFLPDAGFSGEMLLGEHLGPVMERSTERALGDLDPPVAGQIRTILAAVKQSAATPEARTFHAADVIDRVLQMAHYARAADFHLSDALDEMELVHGGPLHAFQNAVLEAAGLIDDSTLEPRQRSFASA